MRFLVYETDFEGTMTQCKVKDQPKKWSIQMEKFYQKIVMKNIVLKQSAERDDLASKSLLAWCMVDLSGDDGDT